MTKWADYLISGIWQTKTANSTYISYVFLHVDTAQGFQSGIKTSRTEVVRLLKAGKTIKTIQWNYANGTWNMGADVGHVTIGGVEYLRSHKDGTINDNLDNLIPMNLFV